MSIISILKELESNRSRTFKESVLSREADNELLKRVCKMTYDPFANYYIRQVPAYTINEDCEGIDLSGALDNLEQFLASRKYTGNIAVQALGEWLSKLTEGDAEVIKRVLKGDLKCGVSAKTINKNWKGLIFEYPCMLAQPDKEKNRAKIVFPALAQCLSEDWVVSTENGGIKIKDIVEGGCGVSVYSYNHNTHSVEIKPVIDVMKRKLDKKWYVLTIDGEKTPPVTGDHLVWVENRSEYVRVDQLKNGDSVLRL